MKPNRWIELSRRIYGRLLYLYPKEYRLEYGPSMLQVFNDQCRSAYQNGGVWGLIALWFRILLDLGISALREQVSSPRSSWGLLEAIPNAPLPWKGVAMVLVPGLIFFVAQIGQLSGQDWFDLMVYRAAYFLIIPVILVGAITRKFPIWGLVPLGLFFNTAWSYGYRLQYFYLNQSNSISSRLMYLVFQYQIVEKIVIVAGPLSLMAILVWLSARRRQFSPWAWAWIGIYLLLIAITMRYSFLINLDNFNWKFYSENISPSDFYFYSGFLLLILFGTLLARRHGRLVILLPLGYLLPTVLYGHTFETPLFWISGIVLVYRVLIAVVAPVWIVRSASDMAIKRASTIVVLAVIGIQVAMHVGEFVSTTWQSWVQIYYYFSPDLLTIAGIALALSLYKSIAHEQLQLNLDPQKH
jgi:hypothetical protein